MSSISVVIPTYDGSAFVGEAMASVAAQTLLPKEIIVVDDASTDGTPDLVAKFARASSVAVRLIRKSRNSGGPAHPLNIGIRAAHHDFIAILEQDDLMTPSRLDDQFRALKEHPEGSLCIGRFKVFGTACHEGIPRRLVSSRFEEIGWIEDDPQFRNGHASVAPQAAFQGLLRFNFTISNSNLCFRKRLWERVGGFDVSITTSSDLDFVLRAALEGPLIVSNAVSFQYRWRVDSLNRRSHRRTSRDWLRILAKAARARPHWLNEENWKQLWGSGRFAIEHSHPLEGLQIAWMLVRSGAFRKRLHSKFQEWRAGIQS